MNLIENTRLSMVRSPLQAPLLTIALVMPDVAHAGKSKSTETVNVWPEGRMPGRATQDPEMEKPSKDAFHPTTTPFHDHFGYEIVLDLGGQQPSCDGPAETRVP